MLYLQIEPVPNTESEQFAGDREKEYGRNQCQNQKCDDQFSLEFGAYNFAFAFIINFDKITHDENDQYENQDQNNIEHCENDNIVSNC